MLISENEHWVLSQNCLEVMNNENILEKEKKIVAASLPIKNIDEIELIKDLYRRKIQLQELLMYRLTINTGLGVYL